MSKHWSSRMMLCKARTGCSRRKTIRSCCPRGTLPTSLTTCDTSADMCRTPRAGNPLGVARGAPQQLGSESLPNVRLSAHKTARTSMPFAHLGLEFELMQSHPYSYSAQTSDFATMATLRGLEIRSLFSDMGVASM